MRAPHLTPPVELLLPGGLRAAYVAGSDPPAYAINGEPLSVDVVIPDDLALAGWFWWGSYLTQRYPDREGAPWVQISTGTFPPPGVASDRQTCFDAAREIERVRAETQAALSARPPRWTKKTKRASAAPPALVQAAMELR